jgi:UDP-glucose 4-epimerase
MDRIGVLGSTSPLGKSLVQHLVESGFQVRAGYRAVENVPEAWNDDKRIECGPAALEEPDAIASAFRDCRAIVWLAHRDQGRQNPREEVLNLEPLKRFCSQIPRLGIARVVFISSGGSVYGEPHSLPINEDHPRNPLSSYGRAKMRMEDALERSASATGFQTAILRPGNIYGPTFGERRAKGIVAALIRSLFLNQPFTMIGDGSVVRDYVHADDVSGAIVAALRSEHDRIVWNVGTGIGTSVSEIVDLVSGSLADKSLTVRHEPGYPTDASKIILSTDRIRREGGWSPDITVEDGIHDLVGVVRQEFEERRETGSPEVGLLATPLPTPPRIPPDPHRQR